MLYGNIAINVITTVASGLLLALILFFVKERWFGIPNITGKWYFEKTTLISSYTDYEGMILRYVAVIWREGGKLSGTVEKIYENSVTGEREYVGDKRSRGRLEGYYEVRYFSKDKIYIHIEEKGHGRESTSYFELEETENGGFIGFFNSFVANQEGQSTWQRKPF